MKKMKIMKDLMEAYSEYVGLPLILSSVVGEMTYIAGEEQYCMHIDCTASVLSELSNVAVQLHTPTIISLSISSSPDGCFYFITPIFKVKESKSFLVAGPFFVESHMVHSTKKTFNIFNDEEIEERLSKIKNLYQLFENKEQVESNFIFPENLIALLQKMENVEERNLDEQVIYRLVDEFLQFGTFDFLGIAVKNENDVFVIQHINGDNVEHLKGKRFYMGEGLLGKAGILGKDFYWSKGIGAEKAEFLNRYGIFPKHLFGYVIKQNETVRSIIFGGSFHDEIISENLLKSIRFFIDLIVQKRMVQSKLHYYQYVKTIFDHFLDFLDIVMNMHDQKVIFHELLEFCYLLSNEKFACFTLNEEFVYKGKMDTEGMERHQLIASNKLSSIKIDERWLHFSIAFDHDHIGYYTLMMDNKNKQLMIYLLNLITALLNNKGEGEKKESSIFDLLYESMKEMNREQYQLADLSMKFAKKIMDILKIKDPQERLLNVCKILPFPMEFLENHIAHTEEWQMISKINYYLKGNESIKEESLELKILLFIYKLIIQKEDKERIDFLDRELYKIFMKVYRATCESPKDLLTEKKEGNGEHIEDMADLKSVISTLTLTPREKEILYLILEGLNNQEVGDYLNISVHTVKNHVTNIFKKLNVSDRIQAMVKIYRIKSGEQLYI